jgi:hypothetical protein
MTKRLLASITWFFLVFGLNSASASCKDRKPVQTLSNLLSGVGSGTAKANSVEYTTHDGTLQIELNKFQSDLPAISSIDQESARNANALVNSAKSYAEKTHAVAILKIARKIVALTGMTDEGLLERKKLFLRALFLKDHESVKNVLAIGMSSLTEAGQEIVALSVLAQIPRKIIKDVLSSDFSGHEKSEMILALLGYKQETKKFLKSLEQSLEAFRAIKTDTIEATGYDAITFLEKLRNAVKLARYALTLSEAKVKDFDPYFHSFHAALLKIVSDFNADKSHVQYPLRPIALRILISGLAILALERGHLESLEALVRLVGRNTSQDKKALTALLKESVVEEFQEPIFWSADASLNLAILKSRVKDEELQGGFQYLKSKRCIDNEPRHLW